MNHASSPFRAVNTAAPQDAELFAQVPELVSQIRRRVSRTIVGQEQAMRVLLTAILAEGHVLLVGVPGLAKTLLVRSLAEALGWRFGRIQFTPDLMPGDVVGSELLQETASGSRAMRFVPGPVFTNLLLADEINRTPPRTQSALLEAMQERTVTSLGRSHRIEAPFIVVATQNPIEQEGTYPLPEAQLDRFMFSLRLEYPTLDQERHIALHPRHRPCDETDDSPDTFAGGDVSPALDVSTIRALQDLTRRVPVTDVVRDYAVAIVRATRPDDAGADEFVRRHVMWGAGPRGSQHLVLAARALALLDNLPTPASRHIREAAVWVLSHRIVPSYAATAEDVDAPAIVSHVLKAVPERDT